MNILFSQVREDPDIELFVANEIDKLKTINKKRYLLVGSGGCTLLTLLSIMDKNDDFIIDVIDMNIEQIYLIQLKIAVIKYYVDKNNILDFFEGTNSNNIDILDLDLSHQCRTFWKKNNKMFKSGINQNGVFELLFKDLVSSNYNFEKVFDRENLINKFGEIAVINSLNKEFYDHFRGILERYKSYDIDSNYFYYQIVNNKYNRNCLPKYFDNIYRIIENSHKINYICSDFTEYVKANKCQYNMIHTSNLTDWVSKNKLNELLNMLYKSVCDNGYIIMRRLNGDYVLKDVIENNGKFNVLDDIPKDKSEFYSEVVICYK